MLATLPFFSLLMMDGCHQDNSLLNDHPFKESLFRARFMVTGCSIPWMHSPSLQSPPAELRQASAYESCKSLNLSLKKKLYEKNLYYSISTVRHPDG